MAPMYTTAEDVVYVYGDTQTHGSAEDVVYKHKTLPVAQRRTGK